MNFYDEVMREILAALGAAMFCSRLLVLVRRGRARPGPTDDRVDDTEAADTDDWVDDDTEGDDTEGEDDDTEGEGDDTEGEGGDDTEGWVDTEGDDTEGEPATLRDEPLARTITFLVIGFVVMVVGVASLIAR